VTNAKPKNIYNLTKILSSNFEEGFKEVAIILAAGHGKRIKSQKSKMLHKIWGIPTVQRVYNACIAGISNIHSIIVVGIKAEDVIKAIGKRDKNIFAFQEKQNGTGHAVQVALNEIRNKSFDGIVYILPGDMGLINRESLKEFRKDFIKSNSDMIVLTGIYNGDPVENSYGRIIRVKDKDREGKSAGKDFGKVIRIIENKDIHALPENKPLEITFNNKIYCYLKNELINNNEFNSGVYAFKYTRLKNLVNKLKGNNVQKEIYITDLIELFNKKGYSVQAVSPKQQHVVMGFNNKSVLKEMENVARKNVYDQLKDIIEIEDPDDFFIHEDVVIDILKMDKKGFPVDIKIDRGVFIGSGVKLNYNLSIGKNTFIAGNVRFGKNAMISENVYLSTFENQHLNIDDNVEILQGNIIKGNIRIGKFSRIESSVNMTGSDEFPLRIGKNVLIKGTSYIFGSVIGNDVKIEHSVLVNKKVKSGSQVKYFLPKIVGEKDVSDI